MNAFTERRSRECECHLAQLKNYPCRHRIRRVDGLQSALSSLLTGIFKFFPAKTRCVALADVLGKQECFDGFATAVIQELVYLFGLMPQPLGQY